MLSRSGAWPHQAIKNTNERAAPTNQSDFQNALFIRQSGLAGPIGQACYLPLCWENRQIAPRLKTNRRSRRRLGVCLALFACIQRSSSLCAPPRPRSGAGNCGFDGLLATARPCAGAITKFIRLLLNGACCCASITFAMRLVEEFFRASLLLVVSGSLWGRPYGQALHIGLEREGISPHLRQEKFLWDLPSIRCRPEKLKEPIEYTQHFTLKAGRCSD